MKEYIDLVLKKEKKAIDLDKLFEKVESCIQKDSSDYRLSNSDKKEIKSIISKGIDKLEYYMTPNGNIISFFKTSFRKGRFYGNKAGEGLVVATISYVDKNGNNIVKEEKFSITKDNCSGAIDGDYVLIDIGGNGIKPRVDRVLNRNLENVVGEVVRVGGSFFLKPLDKKKQQLTIALDDEVIEGEIVSVSLEESGNNFYIGRVNQVFKHKDDPNEDILLEAFKCGMPEGFSNKSLEQLEYIPDEVRKADYEGRYDFTDKVIFSIDGSDTKDKDDCISLEYLLGVHIADVNYYVKEGSPIDKDAFRKGTSYYFGGCVEPQLPRKLSNGICSLNDGVDRLTKTILMEFDKNGKIVSRSLVPSVIHSRIGMTYEKVNKILNEGIVDSEYAPYVNTLIMMEEFSKKLREKREESGAIDFDRPEIQFTYDSNGQPTGVKFRHQGRAEKLIEEFMLIANVNVIEMLEERGIPCIYRVHGTPNTDRLSVFLDLLNVIGIPFDYSVEEILENKGLLQELTEHIKGHGMLDDMLTTNLIKCMSHAQYSTNNIGHYGTGFKNYCHFTSPIRRLADFGLSRIIDECLFEKDESKKRKNIKKWYEKAVEYAAQASKMEKVEEEVEKNVDLMSTARYLSNSIGHEFEGTVINISSNGLTIQLDNLLEGRVRTKNLKGGYTYNPLTYTLLSLEGYDNYFLGDRLRLKLISADKDTKTVDFEVIEKIKENYIDDTDNSNYKVFNKARDDRYRKAFQ